MDFLTSEDQQAITETARTMFLETCTPADLRRMLQAKAPLDEARWTAIKEMGLLGAIAPEDQGGLGLPVADIIGIAEAAGYTALPEPLVTMAGVAIPLLAELDDDRGWLGRAIDGAIVAVAQPEGSYVDDADLADALILADGADLHIVSRNAVTLTRQESFDPLHRRFKVAWSPSATTKAGSGWGLTAQRGALLAAAQMIGLGQRLIDISVAYAKDRAQFGKPIGSNQAVKHLLASAQVKVEFARPVVAAAAAELPLDSAASAARVAHAKIAAGEAADLAARTAVQVHGAMGMTWEVDVHLFLKRAFVLRQAWGTPAKHRATVLERCLSLPTGPAATFASALADA